MVAICPCSLDQVLMVDPALTCTGSQEARLLLGVDRKQLAWSWAGGLPGGGGASVKSDWEAQPGGRLGWTKKGSREPRGHSWFSLGPCLGAQPFSLICWTLSSACVMAIKKAALVFPVAWLPRWPPCDTTWPLDQQPCCGLIRGAGSLPAPGLQCWGTSQQSGS
jgi:hypothetical protein